MADWKLVHQGGHHDVYCNDEQHIKCGGGWSCTNVKPQEHRAARNHMYRCDCARWVKKAS